MRCTDTEKPHECFNYAHVHNLKTKFEPQTDLICLHNMIALLNAVTLPLQIK